jgi:hypothetical protein
LTLDPVKGTSRAGGTPCAAQALDADGLRRRLVEAAVTGLRERRARTIRCLIDVEDVAARGLFEQLGFASDMAWLSLYESE